MNKDNHPLFYWTRRVRLAIQQQRYAQMATPLEELRQRLLSRSGISPSSAVRNIFANESQADATVPTVAVDQPADPQMMSTPSPHEASLRSDMTELKNVVRAQQEQMAQLTNLLFVALQSNNTAANINAVAQTLFANAAAPSKKCHRCPDIRCPVTSQRRCPVSPCQRCPDTIQRRCPIS